MFNRKYVRTSQRDSKISMENKKMVVTSTYPTNYHNLPTNDFIHHLSCTCVYISIGIEDEWKFVF